MHICRTLINVFPPEHFGVNKIGGRGGGVDNSVITAPLSFAFYAVVSQLQLQCECAHSLSITPTCLSSECYVMVDSVSLHV